MPGRSIRVPVFFGGRSQIDNIGELKYGRKQPLIKSKVRMYKNLQEEIEIPPDNPFKNDKLEREGVAANLSKIVKTYTGPLVLSVNGPWGYGKTTFIKMWKQSLENNGHPCIYLNAWKNDFSNNPFFSFLGEIDQFIKEFKSTKITKAFNKLKKTAGKYGSFALKRSLELASTSATLADGGTSLGALKVFTDLATIKIDSYLKEQKSIEDFKKDLTKFSEKVNECEGFIGPLIIFVDELDRCRPDYAVKLLETIKHFFDVNGIVFVLGIDRDQLSHSVKCLYGSEMNADGYLKRFINHEFTLPDPQRKNFCQYLFEYFQMTDIFLRDDLPALKNEEEKFASLLADLVECFSLDLRTIAQIVSRLNIALRQIAHEDQLFVDLYIILVVVKSVNEYIFKRLLKRGPPGDALSPLEKQINVTNIPNSSSWKKFKVFAQCCMMNESEYSERLSSVNYPHDDELALFEAHWLGKFLDFSLIHESIFSKIEFTERFK